MTTAYRMSIQFDLTVTDEGSLRESARDEALVQLAANEGVAPNDFVDNDQQAADHIAQDLRMAVTMTTLRALRLGMEVTPVTFSNVQIQNEPM